MKPTRGRARLSLGRREAAALSGAIAAWYVMHEGEEYEADDRATAYALESAERKLTRERMRLASSDPAWLEGVLR